MSVRANVIFDDEIWNELQKQPRGERSRLVNEAVAAWLTRMQRNEAIRSIRERASRQPPLPMPAEDLVRADRESH